MATVAEVLRKTEQRLQEVLVAEVHDLTITWDGHNLEVVISLSEEEDGP